MEPEKRTHKEGLESMTAEEDPVLLEMTQTGHPGSTVGQLVHPHLLFLTVPLSLQPGHPGVAGGGGTAPSAAGGQSAPAGPRQPHAPCVCLQPPCPGPRPSSRGLSPLGPPLWQVGDPKCPPLCPREGAEARLGQPRGIDLRKAVAVCLDSGNI